MLALTACEHRGPLQAKGVEFVLPTDVVVADKFDKDADSKVVKVGEIPDGWMVSPWLHHVCSSVHMPFLSSPNPV